MKMSAARRRHYRSRGQHRPPGAAPSALYRRAGGRGPCSRIHGGSGAGGLRDLPSPGILFRSRELRVDDVSNGPHFVGRWTRLLFRRHLAAFDLLQHRSPARPGFLSIKVERQLVQAQISFCFIAAMTLHAVTVEKRSDAPFLRKRLARGPGRNRKRTEPEQRDNRAHALRKPRCPAAPQKRARRRAANIRAQPNRTNAAIMKKEPHLNV